MVIEIDGGQHCDEKDAGRTGLIEEEGYRLLRFWNNEVLGNPEGVHRVICSALDQLHPHPASLIKGEEP
jgi:very-short-patch-repair endonuclease